MWALLCVPAFALGAEGRDHARALRGHEPERAREEPEHRAPYAPEPEHRAPALVESSAWGQDAQPGPPAPQSWGDLPGWFLAKLPAPEPAPPPTTPDWFLVPLHALPVWILAVCGVSIGAVVVFICFLIRFIHDGYEVHWMAGLPAVTDFARLSDGDFIKVVGHVVVVPGNTLLSPLSRTPCAAYSVHVAGKGPRAKSYTRVSQVKSFCVQDEQGRLLLVQGHEAVLYNLSATRDWSLSAATAPKEFQPFVPKEHRGDEARQPSATPLRYREAVLEVGAKVCCVGTASTLPTPHAPVSLRPAYATLMFRDAQIPWNKLSGLSTADWGKVAASVLVTSYRFGQ